MTIDNKKGFYYWFIRFACIASLPGVVMCFVILSRQFGGGTLLSDYHTTLKSLFLIALELYFFDEVFKHGRTYSTVSTTKYNLFKCRESGTEKHFMMFADTEKELEKFFEYTRVGKKVFIEDASISATSIKMKIFDGDVPAPIDLPNAN